VTGPSRSMAGRWTDHDALAFAAGPETTDASAEIFWQGLAQRVHFQWCRGQGGCSPLFFQEGRCVGSLGSQFLISTSWRLRDWTTDIFIAVKLVLSPESDPKQVIMMIVPEMPGSEEMVGHVDQASPD